jgi:acetyl-CoA carboxylase biotin carboxyl carrier protein
MDINDIEKVLKMLQGTDVTDFELEHEGVKIKLIRKPISSSGEGFHTEGYLRPSSMPLYLSTPQSSPTSSGPNLAEASGSDKLMRVESPIVGTFYRKPSPDSEPFINEGDRVKKGQTICIVEAMKLMNEIPAPCDGIIQKIPIGDGQVVEYGETIVVIEPSN